MLEAMSLNLDARTFRDLLADPAAAEGLSAVMGSPLGVVEADDAPAGGNLARLDIPLSPAVVRPAGSGRDRVLVERAGRELRVTLSRPARRNAVDWRMRDALAGALAIAAADPGLQVVLRGAGPDFCAGGDLDEFGSRPDPAIAHLTRLTRSPAALMQLLAARTTAYLHGSCLGAGIELPAFAGRGVAAESCRR